MVLKTQDLAIHHLVHLKHHHRVKTTWSPPTSMVSDQVMRNIGSGQGINTNYPLSTMPSPSIMTTLTSVTPSSNIPTSVVKKVAPYPTPRLRTTNQEGPTLTPIT